MAKTCRARRGRRSQHAALPFARCSRPSVTRSTTSSRARQALVRLATGRAPAVILLDLILPGMSGLQVLDRTRQDHPEIPVLVLSTEAQIKTVVDAVRRGASDYLTKPFEEQELELALQNVLEKRELREEVRILKGRLDRGDMDLVSSNPAMLRIKEIARQVADTDAPVLMLGESGVGKEVLARYIHGQSRRARQPFVKVNCAALPQDLLESELFGYEKGAFSGAMREKPGMFELADKGSILLDEIGEMTPQPPGEAPPRPPGRRVHPARGPASPPRRRARPGLDQHPARGGGAAPDGSGRTSTSA